MREEIMSELEVKPGFAKRVFACLFCCAGVSAFFQDRASDRIIGAILLLAAWDLAFMPSLPLNLRLGEIYDRARQGWRQPWVSRVISLATIVLAIYAGYLKAHGR
jgi:uncharacterized membrane protein YfcA